MTINHTAIIGMGALGIMYGSLIQQAFGHEALTFVMDADRYARHHKRPVFVNGTAVTLPVTQASQARLADLVLVATKYPDLDQALETMRPVVGPNTLIVSLLNGIVSEEEIAHRYGATRVLPCVAIGMDAVRDGSQVSYSRLGRLQIGLVDPGQQAALAALGDFLGRAGIPYTLESDIRRAIWAKFLLNVGINQACMVYETTYGGVLNTAERFETMLAAMREVIPVAQAEGIMLGEADVTRAVQILRTLQADASPSMRQDALAKRPTEVALFAGTVIQLADKHSLPAPVNRFFAQRIQALEAAYGQGPDQVDKG